MRVHGLTRRSLFRAGTLAGGGLAAPALLSGCGTGNPAAAAGNVLRVSQTADTTTMDPQKQGDMTSMNVLINIFDTLTARSLSNTLAPGLARSWRIVDEKTWRFVLRQGVRFHNVGRRAGRHRRPVRRAAASVHQGAAVGDPGAGPGRRTVPAADRAARRSAEPDRSAAGLSVPSALPGRPGRLPSEPAGTGG